MLTMKVSKGALKISEASGPEASDFQGKSLPALATSESRHRITNSFGEIFKGGRLSAHTTARLKPPGKPAVWYSLAAVPGDVKAGKANCLYVAALPSDAIKKGAPKGKRPGPEILTDAEREVAVMLAKGLSVNEVAKKRKRTAKTIGAQAYRTYRKLKVHNRVQLAQWVQEHGLE